MTNLDKREKIPLNKGEDMIIELNKFKHSIHSRVQFSDVDSVGVVHNIKYFYLLEYARTEYFRELGIEMNKNTFIRDFPVMLVHNEIDLLNSIHFNDEYQIFSRISYVGFSSFEFKNIIISENKIIARAKATLVYLNMQEYRPIRIPDNIRNMIKDFEVDNVIFSE